MENLRSPFLSWPRCYQGKGIEGLQQALILTSIELNTTRAAAQGELRKREEQLIQLKGLLNEVIRERDDAFEKCHKLLIGNLFFQLQQQQMTPGASSIEEDQTPKHGTDGFSSSDCEESIVSSPVAIDPPLSETSLRLIAVEKPLPEKGKLLQAVTKAGPLLQTLLLAGPLPQWRHPPPPLESAEIPLVAIPAITSPEAVHQEVFLVNPASSCEMINRKRE